MASEAQLPGPPRSLSAVLETLIDVRSSYNDVEGWQARPQHRRKSKCAMRYAKDQKQATRQRIIDTSGRRFKKDGIDGSGIATLMADAGLTNGAFYAHFDSKDDLVAAVVAHELEVQAASAETLPAGRAGLEVYVREYLSAGH